MGVGAVGVVEGEVLGDGDGPDGEGPTLEPPADGEGSVDATPVAAGLSNGPRTDVGSVVAPPAGPGCVVTSADEVALGSAGLSSDEQPASSSANATAIAPGRAGCTSST